MSEIIERWKRKRLITDDGCWIYTGAKRHGYGWVGYKGKNMSISRAILIEMFGNPNNKEIHACHKCKNRACFNPDHLYFGTRSENTYDSVKDGTHPWILKNSNRSGEKHPCAKFTNEFVKKIRHLNKTQKLGPLALSKMFSVNINAVNNVLYNKNRFKGV